MIDAVPLKIGLTKNYKAVSMKNRYLGCFVGGKSGTGKSAFMIRSIDTDSYFGYSVIAIDPSGFFAKDAYSCLSKKRKVHYISLDHTDCGMNPMRLLYDNDTIVDVISNCIDQTIVKTTANERETVNMRQLLAEAIKYCLDNNRRSLVNVRDYLVNGHGLNEARTGLTQRINFLIEDERMKRILCSPNTVNIGEIIQKGESLILDCSKMSTDKLIFIGTLLTVMIQSYFQFERPDEFKPCCLYVDECHNFISDEFSLVLKEGRKFKIAVTLASTEISTFNEKLRASILNCGNLIFFKSGYREASIIAKEVDAPVQAIQFLEKFHVVYLTDKERGICKTIRPPFIKKVEIKKAEPKIKSKGWFPLRSYQAQAPQ